jgi:hypothetical protein
MAALVVLARTPLRLHSACRSRRGRAWKSILAACLLRCDADCYGLGGGERITRGAWAVDIETTIVGI